MGKAQEAYQVKPFAGAFLADLLEIDRTLLDDHKSLRSLFRSALKKDGFHIEKEVEKKFKPHGYTIVFVLGESHGVLTTYPEKGTLHLTLESCRSTKDGPAVLEILKNILRPKRILIHPVVKRVIDPAMFIDAFLTPSS